MSQMLERVKAALKSELGSLAWDSIDRAARKAIRAVGETQELGYEAQQMLKDALNEDTAHRRGL